MHARNELPAVRGVVDSSAVRSDWCYEAAVACQRLVNHVLTARRNEPLVASQLRDLPTPQTRMERLVLHGLLFELMMNAGDVSEPDSIALILRTINARATPTPAQRARAAARRAAAIIDAHFTDRLNVPRLAAQLECHETTLRRAFRQIFKTSLRQHHTKARVRAGYSLFRGGTRDVLAVARQVGYRSEKDFYRAVREMTGGTMAELRAAALRGDDVRSVCSARSAA